MEEGLRVIMKREYGKMVKTWFRRVKEKYIKLNEWEKMGDEEEKIEIEVER